MTGDSVPVLSGRGGPGEDGGLRPGPEPGQPAVQPGLQAARHRGDAGREAAGILVLRPVECAGPAPLLLAVRRAVAQLQLLALRGPAQHRQRGRALLTTVSQNENSLGTVSKIICVLFVENSTKGGRGFGRSTSLSQNS